MSGRAQFRMSEWRAWVGNDYELDEAGNIRICECCGARVPKVKQAVQVALEGASGGCKTKTAGLGGLVVNDIPRKSAFHQKLGQAIKFGFLWVLHGGSKSKGAPARKQKEAA